MGAQHTVLTSPDPPTRITDQELAGYVQSLRRRIEVLNAQIETLVIQGIQKDDRIESLCLDLAIKEADHPNWKKVL